MAFANQFLIKHPSPGEFVLTVGALVPPPLLGTDEEKLEQAKKLPYIPINVLGRYGLTRERLAQLIEVLQTNLEEHDRRRGEQGQ